MSRGCKHFEVCPRKADVTVKAPLKVTMVRAPKEKRTVEKGFVRLPTEYISSVQNVSRNMVKAILMRSQMKKRNMLLNRGEKPFLLQSDKELG